MIRAVARGLACGFVVALTAGPARAETASPGATISFNGTDYFHRWSRDGQNEYTPKG